MDTIKMKLRVERKELSFVDKILKSYEGLAFTTVLGVEGDIGFLNIETTPGTEEDVLKIVDDLQKNIDLKILESE